MACIPTNLRSLSDGESTHRVLDGPLVRQAGHHPNSCSDARRHPGRVSLASVLFLLGLLGGCAGGYDAVCRGPAEDMGLLVVTGACGAMWVADEATRRAEQVAARTSGAEQARARHKAWLLRDASSGDDQAAYRLAVLLAFEKHPDATKWACAAASNGHRPARVLLASWYNPKKFKSKVRPERITDNPAFAYVWYTLATSRDDENAELFRRRLGAELTATDRVEVQRIVEAWRPGLCPQPIQR